MSMTDPIRCRVVATRRVLLGLLALAALPAGPWPSSPASAETPPPPTSRGGSPPARLSFAELTQGLDVEPLSDPVATSDPPPTVDEERASPLPMVPLSAPRPARGPEAVSSFVESLKANDATFEVVVRQGRILTVKEDLTSGRNQALIAVGDPSVIDFTVVSPRQIRITGLRIGVTDLSVTTAGGRTYSFEVRVVADLALLRGQLRAIFPDASLRLGQIREHVVVEGEARDTAQVGQIIRTISAYLASVQTGQAGGAQVQRFIPPLGGAGAGQPEAISPDVVPPPPTPVVPGATAPNSGAPFAGAAGPELNPSIQTQSVLGTPQVINLLRVPGSQQVMLKVRVAELNRSALRRIGANFLGIDPKTGGIVGSQIGGAASATGTTGIKTGLGSAPLVQPNALIGTGTMGTTANTTVFGIFQDANFEFTLNALRHNSFLKVLAEPNLVAMSGYQASFLAGGEFPVPTPQVSTGGIAPTITVRFREFGVRLGFLPYILDGDIIRLTVAPEVSQIDFTIATTLVAGGSPVPGLNTRKAQTTVELRQGQTLAIAGLLQLTLDGSTDRIPGLGDLPIIGPFFSNTTSERIEKELVVLVTPYLIEPMNRGQVPPTPGDEVKGPNDLELFFLNRIEGRTGKDFRATTNWDDPFHLVPLLNLEQKYVHGPCGFSD